MTLTGETGKGIINCRVNGEHKQIRFWCEKLIPVLGPVVEINNYTL
jgi:hypothetical protein